ncbi:MAG TPA: FIST N-terminal domain-containing protein [Kofleriaceae bacterium]|jgi:hypothetical protein
MELTQRTFTKGGWDQPLPQNLDSDRTLVLVFGATSFLDDPAALGQIADAMPRSHRVGCSTSGEIEGTRVRDESLSVAIAKFARTEIGTASVDVTPETSFAAGAAVAKKLAARPGLKAVLLLSDGLAVNGTALAEGVSSVLPPSVVVSGGLAGDGDRFKRTWVLEGSVPRQGRLSAVGLYGDDVIVGHGSSGGWDKFGPERTVTAAMGNVLHSLDGRSALELYKEYLGDRASGLPATGLLFPLAIRSKDHDKVLVRTVLAVDEAAGTLTFAGDIPVGCRAQLMKANFDRLISAASDAAAMTRQTTSAPTDGPVLSLAISCVGRRLVLAERTEEELEATADQLAPGSVQVGFYSYGELSPYGTDGRCDLHNQTMTLTVLGERA